MKGRWVAVAIAVAGLVAINLVARVVVRLVGPTEDAEFVIGLWSLGAMLVAIAVAAFVWTRRYVVPRVLMDAAVVIGVTSLIVTVVGPFVSGGGLHRDSPGDILLQFSVCAGVLGVGVAIGLLGAMALGMDPTSRAWKYQAERVRTSPRQRQGRTARR
jgi:hypothetical protein